MPELLQKKPSNIINLTARRGWDRDSELLAVLKADLAEVDQGTERSFLDLGSKVELFHRRADGISAVAGDVLHLLQGEQGENTLQHLQLLIERCSLWLAAASVQSTQICNLLKNVSQQITTLADPVAGLRKVSKTLHSLRVSTRIEAARGYASGGGVLATSLDELGQSIHGKTADIFARTEALLPKIGEALAREESSHSRLLKVAAHEVQSARRLLNTFVANNIETGEWTDRLKQKSDEVTKSFSEMIAALQFQDITRQRLEHVRDALENLGSHLEKFRRRSECSRDEEASRLFGRICRLQHGQLSLACQEFLTATDNLTDNLHNLSSNVVAMAGDTRELFRAADAGGDNQFCSVLDVLKTIADYLDQTRNCHLSAGQQLALVCREIQTVSGLVEDVELVSEEMQLLAMNAAISAAHARQKGAGLDVIARNIHAVAEEASAYAQILAGACETIVTHAYHLQEIERDTQSSSDDVGRLLNEARSRTATIEDSFARILDLATQVDGTAAALAEDVNEVVRTIDIKERFRERMVPTLERLDGLSLSVDEKVTATDSANLEALFGELEYCYTMDSERRIHKQFIAEQDLVLSVQETERAVWSDNRHHDLGDNVDLF